MAIGTAGAIIGSSLISGVSSIFGGRSQKKSADQAAATSQRGIEGANAAVSRGTQQAAPYQAEQFGRAAETTQPWRDVGQTGRNMMASSNPYITPSMGDQTGRNQLAGMNPNISIDRPQGLRNVEGSASEVMNNFYASPDYQFRKDEGIGATNANFNANGAGLYGGNALRGVTDYASNLAAGEYGDWYGRQYQQGSDEYNRRLGLQSDNYARGANQAMNLQGMDDSNRNWMYGQNVDNFNRQYGMGMDQANIGMTADNAYLGAGADYANNMSNLYTGEGQAYANNWMGGSGNVANAQLAAGDAGANQWAGVNNAAQAGVGNYMYWRGNQPSQTVKYGVPT